MHHPTPFRSLLEILRPERKDLFLAFVYALAVGLLSLAVPITASAVVNSVALTAIYQQLIVLCLALAAALTLAAILQLLQQVLVEYVQRRIFVRVAAELADRLPHAELSAWDRQHGPELLNRFFDTLTVQKAAATLFMDGIALALQIVIGLVLLASYDPILLGFDAFLIVGLIFILFPLGLGGVDTAVEESAAKYEVAAWLEEIARHPVAFKFAGGPSLAVQRTDQLSNNYLHHRSAHFRVLLRQIAFGFLLQVLASVALLGIGGYLVMSGHLTLGQLVAAQIVVNLVVSSFSKLGKQLESAYDLLAGAGKVGHLLHVPRETERLEAMPSFHGPASLKAHALTYTYPDRTVPAVRDFSLSIAPGERIALIGANGSGKTTIIELLLGLRSPQSGWVEFDGYDLRTLDPRPLRKQIALVQDLELFDGTLVENIRMGRDDIPMADITDALKAVLLMDDIAALPDGVNTRLTAGGSPLSLGQAERVMIARAIVGKPRLLVLDETIDAVHRIIQMQLIPALLNKAAPWTLLVITHSEEIAKLCDRQVVMERV